MAMQEILEERYSPASSGRRAVGANARRPPSGLNGDEEPSLPRRPSRAGFAPGLRLTFRRSIVPRTTRGRILAASAFFAGLALLAGIAYGGQRFLLHDDRFVIPSSSFIQIEGNTHISRAQLLSVFGEDVERNIFRTSLEDRRAQLESLPWVEHATVMRLLPNHLRVAIVERTPIAFVRQGKHIGLVDRNGVLLDMPEDNEAEASAHYSFPVVTGITEDEPQSVRAARMKIYQRFAADLDSAKENISSKLSEVDLSNPEDVKALIPDQATEILVHFGDSDFLDRYRKFEEQMPGWRAQYPRLASADMRYDRQVVLEMQPGTSIAPHPEASTSPSAPPHAEKSAKAKPAAPNDAKAAKTASKPLARPATKKDLSALGQPHFPGDIAAPPTGHHAVPSKGTN